MALALANLRVNIGAPTTYRVAVQVPFPSQVTGNAPIGVGKLSGIWTISLNVDALGAVVPLASQYGTDYLLLWDSVAKTYSKVALSSLGVGGARAQRSVTASPIVVAATDQILNVNINAGAPTCALPASASRNGVPLTFKDVGGQFAAHNLTITPNGTEKIDGLSSLVLNTNYQGVTLNPFNDGTNAGWFLT